MKPSIFVLTAMLIAGAGATALTPALAQSKPAMSGEMGNMEPNGDQGPSSMAFMKAMTKMHQDMSISYTGNADVDFVNGMMPHHQGAIDMAKVELQYGKDPENRKLAQDIIKAQEKEIAEMKAWIAKKGK